MTFKDIQTALKQLQPSIKKTIQEISDFFAQHNLSLETAVLEDVVELFKAEQQKSALARAEAPKGLSTRTKKGLKKFEVAPEQTPESKTHNRFHDINDEAFQTAVLQVAEMNVQKAIIFPQAVASKTHELLIDPENQQILQASITEASTVLEQMMYGFNPTV